ncbi:MAG: ATP-binding protein [Cyanobacteria bacterium SBLK]|nr:ATP-binding protein [Cyanobacteria bacterium SBLK]
MFNKTLKKRNQSLKKIHLSLPTDLGSLPKVLDRFEKLASPRLSPQLYWECQLALAESFTNVVRHAHRDLPPSTPIDLEIILFPRGLEMRIWDCGQPFDWEGRLEEKLRRDDDPWAVGGRGLCLIHKVMDDCQYIPAGEGQSTRRSDRNCLILCKQLPQRSPRKGGFLALFEGVARKLERVLRKIMGLLMRKCSALALKLSSTR